VSVLLQFVTKIRGESTGSDGITQKIRGESTGSDGIELNIHREKEDFTVGINLAGCR
jgi:hypothetical protein